MRTRIRDKKKLPYITAEADTAEEAIRVLAGKLGHTPQIEEARRIRRGGIGGFFARERYLLQASREQRRMPRPVDQADAPEIEYIAEHPAPAESGFGAALTAALYGDAEIETEMQQGGGGVGVLLANDPEPVAVGPFAGGGGEAGFEVGLPDIVDPLDDIPHLDAVGPAPELEPPEAPAWRLGGPAHPVPTGMGRVRWSCPALLSSGIPKVIVEAASGLDERDDLGWINAMADATSRFCTNLPQGPTVFVGPEAKTLAAELGIAVIDAMSPEIPAGSFATSIRDRSEELDWLSAVLRGRNLHLVIGESGSWLHLLVDDPAGVTFTADSAVVDALYVALTLSAPLGFGSDGAGGLIRLSPIDTALAVRRLVGRQ